jgi:hypothetical protein
MLISISKENLNVKYINRPFINQEYQKKRILIFKFIESNFEEV